jgi:phosphoglycolate phosphatase-like HAD superfamily hydrolase
MIKLVAFDWNGTILADTNAVVKSESATRIHFGLPPTNLKEFQQQYTIPIRDYWLTAGFDPQIFDRKADDIHKIFIKHYEPLENLSRTRSGTSKILKWLAQKNIKSIIFSNHIIPHVEKQAKRLQIFHYLNQVLARNSIEDSSHMINKGKGKKLFSYVQSMKLKPTEVIAVGDTTEEIEIGQKFGYYTVALTGGYHSVARLKKAKPDFLINNLAELQKILYKLNT